MPINTVLFDAICALALGLLVFASPQAINTIFLLPVMAVYIVYCGKTFGNQ
jgi:hypothetical protein